MSSGNENIIFDKKITEMSDQEISIAQKKIISSIDVDFLTKYYTQMGYSNKRIKKEIEIFFNSTLDKSKKV